MSERLLRVTRQDVYLALFIVVLGVVGLLVVPPGMTWKVNRSLEGPFESFEECVYRVSLGDAGMTGLPHDANGTLVDSRLELLEDGEVLGPAHTHLSDIAESCDGAFAHLQYGFFFSSSDGSDPNTNGRSYSWSAPQALPAIAHVPLVVLLQVLTAFLLYRLLGRGILLTVAQVVLLLVSVQLALWTVVENDLADRGLFEQQLYRSAFDDDLEPPRFRFVPHHTLNYALNPQHERAGVLQHDEHYLIRRTPSLHAVPLDVGPLDVGPLDSAEAPTEAPSWRVLVLGGSTTYDNAILREQDTWIYQLEQGLLEQYAPGIEEGVEVPVEVAVEVAVEVINGGVGGYSLYENLLHYVSHLRHLDADIVLLFTGINDVQPRLLGHPQLPDYSHYRAPWQASGEVLSPPRAELAWWMPYRFYYLRRVALPGRHRRIGREARVRQLPAVKKWADTLDEVPPTLYRDLLEELVHMAQAHGSQVAIVPQYFTPRTPRDESFAIGVRQHNEVGRQVAAQFGLPFLDEVLAPDAFTPLDTVDNCHFTHRGATKMARLMQKALVQRGLSPRSSDVDHQVPAD